VVAVSARAKEARVEVDYYGTAIEVRCEIEARGGEAESIEELVDKNLAEVDRCFRALDKKASEKYGIKGYSQLILFSKFLDTLPQAQHGHGRGWTSFAEAVLENRPLDPADQTALLYSLIVKSGQSVWIMRSGRHYFITVRVDNEISGTWWGNNNRYAWAPGHPFDNPGETRRFNNAEAVVHSHGRAIEFVLPDLPWELTEKGEAKIFKAPRGCPETWRKKVRRLPQFERFLELWPRDRQVLSTNAEKIIEPYGFREVLKQNGSDLNHEEFGTCLLRYSMINMEYNEARDRRRQEAHVTRNPAEALFMGGDCDELSYALIGLLRMAGFPNDNIKVLRWRAGTPDSHMNLGILPLTGKLSQGSYIEHQEKRFYIMDPAYTYTYNGRLATAWGMLSDEYHNQQAEIHDIYQ